MAWNESGAGERIRAAAPVAVIHVLLALALIYGLAGGAARQAKRDDPTRSFDMIPDQPPPLPPPAPPRHADRSAAARPEGAAAPPNLEAQPRPLEAPEATVPAPTPAAQAAGAGAAASAGAAPVPGPGAGAGGTGNGSGSGSGGGGNGGGGGGRGSGNGGPVGEIMPPRQIAGSLRIQDMPESLQESGFHGTAWVLYRVEEDGRVTHCRITRSSGSTLMDQTTCRLIEQRFRYRPARDETGRPFAGDMEAFHEWESDPLPPEHRRRRGRDGS